MASGISRNGINLLLVGDCGVDTSATGNCIIGEKRFLWRGQPSEAFQTEQAKVQGYNVVVVESPALKNMNTHSDLDQLATEKAIVLDSQEDGFDAVLIVIQFGKRISQEDKWEHLLQLLEDVFGTDYITDYGILVVTPTGKYHPEENNGLTLDEFLQEEKGAFGKIREKCINRLIAFNNRTKDQTVRQRQVKRLLDMVAEMKREAGGYTLSSSQEDLYENMDSLSQNERSPVNQNKLLNSLTTSLKDLENEPLETYSVERMTELRRECKEYLEEVTERNAGEDSPTAQISGTSNLKDTIIGKLSTLSRKTGQEVRRNKGKSSSGITYRVGEDFINILLVGKTGYGKSSTANSIIGEKKFKAAANFSSTTTSCQREVARVQGHNVVIVDSPGLADTEIETDGGLKQLAKEIISIFATQPDGFDIILVTVQYGSRITEEDQRVFDELEQLLGKEYVNHCGILVITHVDDHDPGENGTIEEFMDKQTGAFQHIRQNRVNNRVVYFDNKTKDESVRQAQVKQLLDAAVRVKQNPQTFTPEVCVKAKKARDKVLNKAGKPVISSETTDNLKLIMQELLDIPLKSLDIQQLKNIIDKLQTHYTELKDQIEDETMQDSLSLTVQRLEGAIKMKISGIEKKRDLKTAQKCIHKEISALARLLKTHDELRYSLLRHDLGPVLATFIYPVLAVSSVFKKIVPSVDSFENWLRKN